MANEVPKDSPQAAIIAEEERLYGQVSARVAIGEEPEAEPQLGASDIDEDLLSLRDQIAEARAEDLPPLIEQMTRLAALKARVGGGKQLPVDVASPYFAHMRLRESGKKRDVLVGKRGFIDRASNVQIVDWRNAPVSRIYYRYEEGDDYEEEIAGRRVDGVVEARRNVSISQGRLRRIGAPQGTFLKDSRGHWVQAVGQATPTLHGGMGKAARPVAVGGVKGKLGVHAGVHRADKGLPEIAALIDKEQFELITQPESGFVVIQGGAGSGKTTVALHRIAYLSFADPRRFRPGSMLFVVPSQALVRYVSGVLPSLGVAGVPVVTYVGWARSMRLKLMPDSPAKYNDDPPEVVSRVKKHPVMLRLLQEWCDRQADHVLADLQGLVGDVVLDEWARLAGPLVPRINSMRAWVGRSSLDANVRTALDSALRRWKARADEIMTDWAEMLTDRVILGEAFAGTDVTARDLERLVSWVKRQIAQPAQQPVDEDGNPIEASDGAPVEDDDGDPAGRMDDEDDPIVLRLIQIKRGGLVGAGGEETTYSHVAIDEAQDRSALEVKVLIEAAKLPDADPTHRSVTIAGDTAQRLVFDNNFTTWADLLAQTGQPAVVRPLKLSYRSTAEVMLLAREILGPSLAPEETLAARNGEPVELHEFGDVGEAVAFLADSLRALMQREPTASCAVISRHPEQADAYYDGLRRAEVPALRRVRRDEFNFQPGVDVTDVAQVKGLEFDYVVMVDVNTTSYPDASWARHLLHIGVTRAAHQLWLVSTAEPSALVPAALRDGGRMGVAVESVA
ncbi:MAG TPA: ATP-binding domain-containing protein [Kofleriaceae bacterium]|nr:ATP-binding domain-containing protein [Kofleriaceae bacterium]